MSVCIVGNGMAGARLAVELRWRDPRVPITVLGAEPGPAYNRVLLSDVLAGRLSEREVALAAPESVDLRTGVPAVAIDREARVVVGSDGRSIPYETVVLATGSRPVVPPVPGLEEHGLPFRTVEDCKRIVAAAVSARRAVVLGGGLLGLEAARGLAGRGLDVTVVHLGPYLMERQLDDDAGRMLLHTVEDLGVRVLVSASVVAASEDGVRLADGTFLPADLVVVSCGVRPSTGLASEAGLLVDNGVVVDDELRTSDPRIFAIGDCARHRGTVYGLVAPAWEQARVAAAVILGESRRYEGSRLITRLKARGIDLAAMGEVTGDRAEVVRFVDAARRCYQKVMIRDGRLVGAILLGDNPTVGTVVQAYDRSSVVPRDPRSLLFGAQGGGGAVAEASALPSEATVCRCNGVTAGAIARAWIRGARTVEAVSKVTQAGTGCGGCRDTIADFVAHLGDDAEEAVA